MVSYDIIIMNKIIKMNIANLFNHDRIDQSKIKINEAQRIFKDKLYIHGRQANIIILDSMFKVDQELEKLYQLNDLILPKNNYNYNTKIDHKIDKDYLITINQDALLSNTEKEIKQLKHICGNLSFEEQNIIIYSQVDKQKYKEIILLNIEIYTEKYMYNLYLKELNNQVYKLNYAINNLQIKGIEESFDVINRIIDIYFSVQNLL